MKEPIWIVKEVKPTKDYKLIITFSNDEKRI